MNAPLPPLPASLSRPEAAGDIDARILRVEQRLIAREENVRRGMTAFGHQLGEALQPRRLINPALLVAAGVALLVMLRPKRITVTEAAPAAAAVARPALFALLAGLPWARLVDMAKPLLPARWRGKLSPAMVGGFVSLGLPLIESLLFKRRHRDVPRRH